MSGLEPIGDIIDVVMSKLDDAVIARQGPEALDAMYVETAEQVTGERLSPAVAKAFVRLHQKHPGCSIADTLATVKAAQPDAAMIAFRAIRSQQGKLAGHVNCLETALSPERAQYLSAGIVRLIREDARLLAAAADAIQAALPEGA